MKEEIYRLGRSYVKFAERHPILNISGIVIGACGIATGLGLLMNHYLPSRTVSQKDVQMETVGHFNRDFQ